MATALWERLVSLPIFSGMRDEQTEHVINSVKALCARFKTAQSTSHDATSEVPLVKEQEYSLVSA